MFNNAMKYTLTARRGRFNQGFTLIELIASLALLGILTAVFGLGIVGALNIYAVSEENVHLAQKGQIAMARINRELMELTSVIERNDEHPYIFYANLRGTGVHAIRFDSANSRLLLYSDLPSTTTPLDINAENDVLVDNVAGFTIAYFQGEDPWTDGDQHLLSHIRTQLNLSRTRGIVSHDETFSGRVYLRNTINYGGTAPATEPPQPPTMSGYGCFISTVTQGSHPDYSGYIISIIMIVILVAAGKCIRPPGANRFHESGSTLIAVIAAILIFSTIVAALLPLVSSSGFQSAAQNHAQKAYLLAESGFRYAAGQYLNAGSDTARVRTLDALDNTQYRTGQGSFSLKVYSYFYSTEGDHPKSATKVQATIPGSLDPEIASISSYAGRHLHISSGTYTIQTASFPDNESVIFTISPGLSEDISDGTLIIPATYITASETTITDGGTLSLENTDLIPLKNGLVEVAEKQLYYTVNDRDQDRLIGIRDLNADEATWSLDIHNTDEIVLMQHARLISTGTYGSGGFQVSRTVAYDTPLPLKDTFTRRYEFKETFDEDIDANWTKVWGDQERQVDVGDSNPRLQVTDTEDRAGSPKASLIALASEDVSTALANAHNYSGNYLSYDTQVKIGFVDTDPDPDSEPPYLPEGSTIPKYFAAGVSFRLDTDTTAVASSDNNSYGVSIMRGNYLTSGSNVDNINSDLVPAGTDPYGNEIDVEDKLIIVLWKQTNMGAANEDDQEITWLAYKEIEDAMEFNENFELDDDGWATDNSDADIKWHRSGNRDHSSTASFYYGDQRVTDPNPSFRNYKTTDSANSGTLTYLGPNGEGIALPDSDDISFKFWTWYVTEPSSTKDIKKVEFLFQEGSTNWIVDNTLTKILSAGASFGWQEISVDLSEHKCQSMRVRFDFDTVDGNANEFEGWYVDDVRITTTGRWPIEDAAIVVRIVEAAALSFDTPTGYNSQNDAIEIGDWISTATGRGRVVYGPLLQNGSAWGDSAQGLLLLNNLSGTFTNNQDIAVIGKGSQLAKVSSYSEEDDERNNFIQVFYASPSYCENSGTDSPWDAQRKGYDRLTDSSDDLLWPADLEDDGSLIWSADQDYFRLVQWDAYNTNTDMAPHLAWIESQLTNPNIPGHPIIRHRHTELSSPTDNFSYSRAELGLHALGKGANNIYFDDFGIKLIVPSPFYFPTPIQQ